MGIYVLEHLLIETRGYYIFPNGLPIISLASHLHYLQKQFVCAHELGHHLYDSGLNRTFLNTHMVVDIFENIADAFAAHLLWGKPSPI